MSIIDTGCLEQVSLDTVFINNAVTNMLTGGIPGTMLGYRCSRRDECKECPRYQRSYRANSVPNNAFLCPRCSGQLTGLASPHVTIYECVRCGVRCAATACGSTTNPAVWVVSTPVDEYVRNEDII